MSGTNVSGYSNYEGYKAFDGNDTTANQMNNSNNPGAYYVQYDFSNKVTIRKLDIYAKFTSGGTVSTATTGKIIVYSSNDGVVFDELWNSGEHTLMDYTVDTTVNLFSPKTARFIRLAIITSTKVWNAYCYKLQAYGMIG